MGREFRAQKKEGSEDLAEESEDYRKIVGGVDLGRREGAEIN